MTTVLSQGKTVALHAAAELPDTLLKANFDLTVVTAQVIAEFKAYTELPKPQSITLSDLDASLKDLERDPNADFLFRAHDDNDKPIDFSYASFNEPTLDRFLKRAMLAKALSHQTSRTVRRLVALSSALLGEDVAPGPSFHVTIESLMVRSDVAADKLRELKALQRVARALGLLVPRYAKEARELVAASKELIDHVEDVVTNPNVILHLGTLKRSLETSVVALLETARWSADAAISLRGFASGMKKRDTFDLEEGRLTREELAALLYDPP